MRHAAVLIPLMGCTPDPTPKVAPSGVDSAADSASPGDSADSGTEAELPRRTCVPFAVTSLQTHPDLMGTISYEAAHNALPGPGLAVGDFTGDPHLDVILARPQAPALLFEGDGTGALVLTDTVLPQGDTVATGLLNADATLDIILAGSGEDVVLLSNPDGTRTVVPLPDAGLHSTTVSVFDADGDADLDLFLPRHRWPADMDALLAGEWEGDGHTLLLNDGHGGFSVDPRPLGTTATSLGFQGAPVDVDQDGDLDVYLNNDFGAWTHPNVLLDNDGTGGFTERWGDGTDVVMYAMGTSVADPGGDGWPDLFVSNLGNLVFLESLGDGTFADSAAVWGLVDVKDEQHIASWGHRFIDLDGDRHDDLVMGYSAVPIEPTEREGGGLGGVDTETDFTRIQQDLILLRDPTARAFTVAADNGHTTTDFEDAHGTKSVVAADLDNDGRPELLKAGYSVDFTDLVLRTYRTTGGCGPGVTLRFPLDAHSVGAKVVAQVEDVETTRWMLPSATFGSSAAEVYVGLGEAPTADRVSVTFQGSETIQLDGLVAGTVVDVRPE